MNANPIQSPVCRQGRPVKAMAIWLIDACAIVALSLVMLVVNEFRDRPRRAVAR
jgi:hypothetical protein